MVLDRDLRGRDPARSGQRGDTHRQTDLGRGRPTPQRPGDSCSHIGGIAGIGERDQVPACSARNALISFSVAVTRCGNWARPEGFEPPRTCGHFCGNMLIG